MTFRSLVAATAVAFSMMAASAEAVTFSELIGPDLGSTAAYQTNNFDNPPAWLNMTGTVGTYNGHQLVLDQSTAIFDWSSVVGGVSAISFNVIGAGHVYLLDQNGNAWWDAYVGDFGPAGDTIFLSQDPGDSLIYGMVAQAESAYGTFAFNRLSAGPEVAVTGSVPEPATWAMMMIGFGIVGAAVRRRRTGFASA